MLNTGRDLIRQLNQLAQFARLGGGHRVESDDRIVLEKWLPELMSKRDADAHARQQHLLLEATKTELPVIYGSAYWLGLALEACLDNAIRYSPAQTDIVVSTRAAGAFVRIIVRNHGRGPRSPILRNRMMSPLMRGKASAGLGLGLSLALRIVEMHHGKLMLKQDLDGFVSCTVELPTGGGMRENPAMHLEQAQRYANDLARLMVQRSDRQRSKDQDPEHSTLT